MGVATTQEAIYKVSFILECRQSLMHMSVFAGNSTLALFVNNSRIRIFGTSGQKSSKSSSCHIYVKEFFYQPLLLSSEATCNLQRKNKPSFHFDPNILYSCFGVSRLGWQEFLSRYSLFRRTTECRISSLVFFGIEQAALIIDNEIWPLLNHGAHFTMAPPRSI